MPICVCGLQNVTNHIQNADVVVSILDPKKQIPFSHPKHLVVSFEDIENPTDDEWMLMNAGVRRVLSFIDATSATLDSNIVVHCHAGVSRSSAMAWLILIKLGMDYKDAFTLLIKQNPQIWPNTVVLSIGAGILKLPKEFNAFVSQVNAEISLNQTEFLGYGG